METVWTVYMKTMQSAWGKCRQHGNSMDSTHENNAECMGKMQAAWKQYGHQGNNIDSTRKNHICRQYGNNVNSMETVWAEWKQC